MYINTCKYGYLPRLKRSFLGGVSILLVSLSSLYAVGSLPKTDANNSGVHAKRNSTAIGINGANNVTTVVNNKTVVIHKTVVVNHYIGKTLPSRPKKTPPKTPSVNKATPKTLPKSSASKAGSKKTGMPTPKSSKCTDKHSKMYCETTGKLTASGH